MIVPAAVSDHRHHVQRERLCDPSNFLYQRQVQSSYPSAQLHFAIAAIYNSLQNVHLNHHRIYVRCIAFLTVNFEPRAYWSGAEPGMARQVVFYFVLEYVVSIHVPY